MAHSSKIVGSQVINANANFKNRTAPVATKGAGISR
jgi:hypothetical protein